MLWEFIAALVIGCYLVLGCGILIYMFRQWRIDKNARGREGDEPYGSYDCFERSAALFPERRKFIRIEKNL